MLGDPSEAQQQLEIVAIDQLVPKDHLLRKVTAVLDVEFIRQKTRPLYSDRGRPAVDPVVLFKMLLISFLFGVRSERRVVQEIEVNVAYRWFLGLKLTDSVPHHSTISQNRRRRFLKGQVEWELFVHVVKQAAEAGLIDGKVLFGDSTHIKANANKNSIIGKKGRDVPPEAVERAIEQHLTAMERERELISDDAEGDLAAAVNADREHAGKKPLDFSAEEPKVTPVPAAVSLTDPEAGYMVREGKPVGFHYLEHRLVEGRHGFIVHVRVTSAKHTDPTVFPSCLVATKKTYTFEIEAVGLDAGYYTTRICHDLLEAGIFPAIGTRRTKPAKGMMGTWRYRYLWNWDAYFCPGEHLLRYVTTTREGYRVYRSNPEVCRTCPLLASCTRSKTGHKEIHRHVFQDDKDLVYRNNKTEFGQYLLQRRRETVERSFADGKELHGLRYARYRGREKVERQSLLSATAQNLKKLALLMSRLSSRAQAA